MSRLTKSEALGIIDDFFKDLPFVSQYLNRNTQDLKHRRDRLTQIAGELTRARVPVEFAMWFTRALGEALGARGGIILVREKTWRVLGQWEHGEELMQMPLFEKARQGQLTQLVEEPAKSALGGNTVHLAIPMFGAEHLVAAVLLNTVEPLDGPMREILGALMGTAGLWLEQGIELQKVARD